MSIRGSTKKKKGNLKVNSTLLPVSFVSFGTIKKSPSIIPPARNQHDLQTLSRHYIRQNSSSIDVCLKLVDIYIIFLIVLTLVEGNSAEESSRTQHKPTLKNMMDQNKSTDSLVCAVGDS